MIELKLYGSKDSLNRYYVALYRKLGNKISIKEKEKLNDNYCKLVVLLECKSFNESLINVDGYLEVGLSAQIVLDPYYLFYSKSIGDESLNAKQQLIHQSMELGEFEDLESYEVRISEYVS